MSDPSPSSNDRRQARERRAAGGDRRRGAEGKRAVFEVCRSQVHLAVIAPEGRGQGDLLLCRSLTWRVKADSLLDPSGAEELRIAIKQLAVEERLAGAATMVLINGDLCVNRVAIGSSSKVDHQIDELTERSQIYLALGSGEKAASVARMPIDARHEHAVLSVANWRTIDAVVRASEDAGLELRSVETSAVSLCRAHGELYEDDEPALLVQLDENSVEVALSHRGRLLLDHRASSAAANKSLSEQLDAHHERLMRYCQRQGIGKGIPKALLTGDPKLVEKALQEQASRGAERLVPFDLKPADRHWSTRETPPGLQHVAVLGGALVGEAGVAGSPGPNLLERWIAESRKHIRPMLLRSAAPLAATLLIAAALGGVNYSLYRANLELADRVASLGPVQAEANELRLRMFSKRAKVEQLQKLAGGAPAPPIAAFLSKVGNCLPNDVWLDNLQLTNGKTVTLRGASYTDSGAYDFVSHLNRAPGMKRVALQETRADIGPDGPTTSFTVKAGYAPAAPPSEPKNPSVTADRRPRGAVESGRTNQQHPS